MIATWKGISASAQGETSLPPQPSDGSETSPLESFGFMQV